MSESLQTDFDSSENNIKNKVSQEKEGSFANDEKTELKDNGHNISNGDTTTASSSSTFSSTNTSDTSNQSEQIEWRPEDDEIPTFNIFVGDLEPSVIEQDLIDTFCACGPIHVVRIFRDPSTQMHKGFGFVHFKTKEAQLKALSDEYNRSLIKGQPCRVSPSEEKNTIFVGNIPKDMNEIQIKNEIIKLIGTDKIKSFELKVDQNNQSRGFCFVQFPTHQKAEIARKVLLSSSIRGRPLIVSWAENRREIDEEIMSKVRTLYVTNIPVTATEQVLIPLFSEYGEVTNCVLVKNPQTQVSRGFAFIEFAKREEAMKAMESLSGAELAGQKLSIVLAKPPPAKVKQPQVMSKLIKTPARVQRVDAMGQFGRGRGHQVKRGGGKMPRTYYHQNPPSLYPPSNIQKVHHYQRPQPYPYQRPRQAVPYQRNYPLMNQQQQQQQPIPPQPIQPAQPPPMTPVVPQMQPNHHHQQQQQQQVAPQQQPYAFPVNVPYQQVQYDQQYYQYYPYQ